MTRLVIVLGLCMLFSQIFMISAQKAPNWVTVQDINQLRSLALELGYVKPRTKPPVGDIEGWKGTNSKHDICYDKANGHYAVMLKGCRGEPDYI